MKNKLLSALLLSTQLCLLGVSQISAMDSTAEPVFGKAGHNQHSLVEGNRKVVDDFRKFYRQHSDGSNTDVSLAEYHDFLIPYAQHLMEAMKQDKQSDHFQVLTKEVESHIADKKVSPNWLFDMHFRYLAVQGGMSEEERELLNHVPHNKYIQALLAKDLNGHPIVLDLYKWGAHLDKQGEYYYDQANEHWPYIPGVSEEAGKLIDQCVAKFLPSSIIYPSLGEAILPLKLLMRNWFEQVYHVAFPSTISSYHGIINASRVGFAFHDLFHYKIDQRRRSLEIYIQNLVGQHVMANHGFAVDIIPAVVELAVQKYALIMEALQKAYLTFEDDKHALVGFFAMIHEVEKNFSPEFFTMSNPNKIVKAMLETGLASYAHEGAWENPEDPLHTTVDGVSSLNDVDIQTLAINRLASDPTVNFPYQIYEKRNLDGSYIGFATETAEKLEINKKYLVEKSRKLVIRSGQFVDVLFSFTDGSKKTVSFPTLQRKWNNTEASLGLLAYAGVGEAKIKLNGQDKDKDREDALKFIALLKSKLEGTMKDATQKAQQFFGEGPHSFAADFEMRFKALDEKLIAITKIAPKPNDKETDELMLF